MTDPYYTIKEEGWKHMIDWVDCISTNNTSFKDFCMKHQMDYILFSGYVPYIEKMKSDTERLAFIYKQLHKCEMQLADHIKSKTPSCCLAK